MSVVDQVTTHTTFTFNKILPLGFSNRTSYVLSPFNIFTLYSEAPQMFLKFNTYPPDRIFFIMFEIKFYISFTRIDRSLFILRAFEFWISNLKFFTRNTPLFTLLNFNNPTNNTKIHQSKQFHNFAAIKINI